MFTLFTLACALAPNWPVFLVFRFLVGVFASSPIAVVPGIIADTHADPRSRGRSMGIFFAVCTHPQTLTGVKLKLNSRENRQH